jgi:hypothetical protein
MHGTAGHALTTMPEPHILPYLLNDWSDLLALLGRVSTYYWSSTTSWTTTSGLLDMLREGGIVCLCLDGKIGLDHGVPGALSLSSHSSFILTLLKHILVHLDATKWL